MTGLLFGSHALRQMICGNDAVLLQWMGQQNRGDVYATYNSVARLSGAVSAIKDGSQRRRWQRKLESIPRKLAQRMLSLDLAAAQVYGDFRHALGEEPFDELELLDLAIATDKNMDFVAPAQAWHMKVSSKTILDPWTTSPILTASPTVTSSP